MKKFLLFVSTLVMSLLLSGCFGGFKMDRSIEQNLKKFNSLGYKNLGMCSNHSGVSIFFNGNVFDYKYDGETCSVNSKRMVMKNGYLDYVIGYGDKKAVYHFAIVHNCGNGQFDLYLLHYDVVLHMKAVSSRVYVGYFDEEGYKKVGKRSFTLISRNSPMTSRTYRQILGEEAARKSELARWELIHSRR